MIHIYLSQTRLKGGQRFPKRLLERTQREVSRVLNVKGKKEISAVFVSPKEMRRLNKTYRKKDSMTDVLSFTLDPTESEGEIGEIILSYEQAKRQAKEMKHSVRDEIVFLLVHGILHVFGHDHIKEKDAKKMFPLQTNALKKLGVNPRI